MILTKATDGQITYLLPSGPPPTSISWALHDPAGNEHLAAQAVTPPTLYAVSSGEANSSPDDVTLSCAAPPTELAAGDIARVADDWGKISDGLCYGRSGSDLRVADVPHTLDDEAATVYNPEILLEIPGAQLDATGDGWRIDIVMVQDGVTIKDTLWPSVGLYTVSLRISPREVMDRYPTIRSDLTHLETRRDWDRIVARAVGLVEETILGQAKWYTQIISPTGLRAAVCAAAWYIIAPTAVPEGHDADTWITRAERSYTEAVSAMLASAYTDADLTGKIDDDERNPRARQFHLVR